MSDALHAVAEAFRASLLRSGALSMFRIDGLDRTGVPVVQANLSQARQPVTTGHGYGLTPVEAEVGALGELCEEVHCANWLSQAPVRIASYAQLAAESVPQGVVDPLTLCLPAGCAYTPETTLHWVTVWRWPERTPVLVPRDWIAAHAHDVAESPDLITPITNGLGAGLDLEHAIAHGVMELLQRDGNVLGYRALDQGHVLALDRGIEPETRALLERLRGLGIDVTAKLAATEFGCANLYVVGDDRGMPVLPIQITACGEAAHPDKHRALRKALLEFCGSRARKVATHGDASLCRQVMPQAHVDRELACARPELEEARALDAMAEWLDQDADTLRLRLDGRVFAERRSTRFSDLPDAGEAATGSSAQRLRGLARALSEADMHILFADCSPPDSPVAAVKVVVPGLESETMSYHRIGWRGVARLRERSDPLLLAAPRPGAGRVRLRPQDEARCGGPAWFDAERADRIVQPLYPLYREPGCFSAQLHRQRRRTSAKAPA